MSVIAAALRELMAAGLSGEALAEAVERIEASQTCAPSRTARQERNARYYEKNRDELKQRASENRLKRLKRLNSDAAPSPKDSSTKPSNVEFNQNPNPPP